MQPRERHEPLGAEPTPVRHRSIAAGGALGPVIAVAATVPLPTEAVFPAAALLLLGDVPVGYAAGRLSTGPWRVRCRSGGLTGLLAGSVVDVGFWLGVNLVYVFPADGAYWGLALLLIETGVVTAERLERYGSLFTVWYAPAFVALYASLAALTASATGADGSPRIDYQ